VTTNELLWGLTGLAAGLLIAGSAAWILGQARILAAQLAGRAAREPEVLALNARAERADALVRQHEALELELRATRDARRVAEARSAELGARMDEQQRAFAQRYRDLETSREALKAEFQALAGEILEDKSRRFGEAQQTQLGQLLTPLREQLGDFRRAVVEGYEKENNARVALQTRIDDLVRLNQNLGREAQSLSRALTADNRSQGYWGELKLERLLESAGLEKGQQYVTQESFLDAEGDRYRPDAVLKLPEGKDIVIDAKMVLLDYQRACDASEAEEREQAMARHAGALRNHVRLLGEKDYSRLDGVNAPDLVLLFVPVEGAFLEALRRDATLYDYAFERKIILVGPEQSVGLFAPGGAVVAHRITEPQRRAHRGRGRQAVRQVRRLHRGHGQGGRRAGTRSGSASAGAGQARTGQGQLGATCRAIARTGRGAVEATTREFAGSRSRRRWRGGGRMNRSRPTRA
jgi:DNA recombination protein RmuC